MLLHTVCLATETLIRNYVWAVFHFTNNIRLLAYHQSNMGFMMANTDGKLVVMVSIPVTEYIELKHALQTVLNTFGRTDGVCVTTQTKQHVLHEIRELLERLEHE